MHVGTSLIGNPKRKHRYPITALGYDRGDAPDLIGDYCIRA